MRARVVLFEQPEVDGNGPAIEGHVSGGAFAAVCVIGITVTNYSANTIELDYRIGTGRYRRVKAFAKQSMTIARCYHGCDSAWAWAKGSARIDEMACPGCGGKLSQTTLAYRRTFWVLHPKDVKFIKAVVEDGRVQRQAERERS